MQLAGSPSRASIASTCRVCCSATGASSQASTSRTGSLATAVTRLDMLRSRGNWRTWLRWMSNRLMGWTLVTSTATCTDGARPCWRTFRSASARERLWHGGCSDSGSFSSISHDCYGCQWHSNTNLTSNLYWRTFPSMSVSWSCLWVADTGRRVCRLYSSQDLRGCPSEDSKGIWAIFIFNTGMHLLVLWIIDQYNAHR